RLVEAIEDATAQLGLDADARVLDLDLDALLDPFHLDIDASALRRELDRVGQEVPHHLLEPRRVAQALTSTGRRIETDDDLDAFLFGHLLNGLDRRLYD